MSAPRIVVLVGGVAGTVVANRVARSRQPVDVTIVDDRRVRLDLLYGEPPCVYPPRRVHYWTLAVIERLYFPMIARA